MRALLIFPLVFPPSAPIADALALFRQWCKSPSPELRIQAARTLRGHTGSESRVALLSLLSDRHPAVRAAVRDELVKRPPEEALELAQEVLGLKSPVARLAGLRAILERGENPTPFAGDRDPTVRARALASGRVAIPVVRESLVDRDGRVRALALACLADPALARAHAADRAEEVRIAAARVTDDPRLLAALLQDRSWRVTLAAIRAAERLRRRETIPALIEVLAGARGRIQARASAALESLTGASHGTRVGRWRKWWGAAGATFRTSERKPRGKRRDHTVSTLSFRRIPVVSRRVCFVLDASRSMDKPAPNAGGKSRWDLVVHDLVEILARLPKCVRINVILFRTDVEAWKPRLVAATAAARRACRKWIESAKPAGWTNLYDALSLALSDDAVDAVYLLTDGVPSRGRETGRRAILSEIAFLNRFRLVQINCVQAGGAEGLGKRWRGFLDDLATAHDGVSVRE